MSYIGEAVRPRAKSVRIIIYDETGKKLVYTFGNHQKHSPSLDVELNYDVDTEYGDSFMDYTVLRRDIVNRNAEFTLKVRQ